MPPWFNILMRWLHVSSAVAGGGTTIFMRFVVLPALARIPNGEEVLNALRPGLKRLIHSALGLAILTGFYNYVVPAHEALQKIRDSTGQFHGGEAVSVYNAVIGVKILLSFVLLGVAIALLKPVPAVHENRKTWLSVNTVLGLVILLLAAYLRRLWP